jgi:glycosyltransferase involved in cell wall biosynthesis
MALVSVILTASDRGLLLRRALRSLYAQSFKDWELILVADNPTDPIVLDTLAQLKDTDRVAVIFVPFRVAPDCHPVGGAVLSAAQIKRVAAAVNLGLNAVKSEWVTYLCDDDVYLPGRFELYLSMMKKADAVVGNANFVQDNGAIWHQNKFRFKYPTPRAQGHQMLLGAIQPNHFICHDSIIHRRTKLRWPIDVQPTPNDWRYWCALFKSGFRFVRVEGVGERATMPGMWRAGATQEGVLGLTGEEITGGDNMKRVMYAKNITKKRQSVINSKNVSIMIYPGERINVEDVSFVNAQQVTCLFPGFALCGDFSFPDLAKIEEAPPAPGRDQTVTQTKNPGGEKVEEVPPAPARGQRHVAQRVFQRVFQDEALQVPRTFQPIAQIAGGTVLTTNHHEPKHPFDID